MKQNVSPGVVAVIAVVVVAVLGFAAYKTFGSKAGNTMDSKGAAARDAYLKGSTAHPPPDMQSFNANNRPGNSGGGGH